MSYVHDVERTPKNVKMSDPVPQAYDIPYRALVAADVNGLLMAGRCISGDFLAHSSYRVTGNAVAMGQAAGAAAARAVHLNVCPHDVSYTDQALKLS